MNKLLVAGVLLVALAMTVVGYAAYTVFSNIVKVNVNDYSLILTGSSGNVNPNTIITLTASLKNNTVPFIGQVDFYMNNTKIGSALTDPNGTAVFQWNVTSNVGELDFQAKYEVLP